SRTATKQFALTIVPPPLSISTSSPLPNGTVGTAYSQTLAASGGVPPFMWSVTSGALPAGFNPLAPTTGVISGTPTTAGTVNFTVQLPSDPSQTATKQFALTIDPPPLTITTPSPLPNGAAGTAYSQSLAATGGTPSYTWSVTQGTLSGVGLT